MRTKVAIIRGEALNPYEMQAYVPLLGDFDVLLVGRRNGSYETALLDLPVQLLPSIAMHRPTARVWDRAQRVSGGRLRDADFLFGLQRTVRDSSILHAAETAIPTSEQAARICNTHGNHLILTCWETIPFRFDSDSELRRRKQYVKDAVSRYIAVTERAKATLLEEGVDESKVELVPAAVDCQRFGPHVSGLDVRAQLGLADHQVMVLFVGRLIQEKGVVELVRAFARAACHDSILAIVGSGDQGDRTLHAARSLGVADRVRILPGRSYADVPALYAAADLVVAPSLPTPYWEEQFGMVLVEAMASGKALISTSSGAIPDVVRDAAALVAPYDNESLAHHIHNLVQDVEARQRLGHRARQLALSAYSVESVAPRLAECYRRALAS